jgi:TPR repeat protein
MRRARLLEKVSEGLKESELEPGLIEPILDEAEDGSASAQFIVAAALERASALSEAMHWYRASARQGFQPAKERLRQIHSFAA